MAPTTPTAASIPLPAEEYELGVRSPDEPVAGPSRPRRASKPKRKLTIHAGPSTAVLFSQQPHLSPRSSSRRISQNNGTAGQYQDQLHQHHRGGDSPNETTHRRSTAHFLNEDLDYFGQAGPGGPSGSGAGAGSGLGVGQRTSEEVLVPDFGQMLGLDQTDEDHYAIAAGMKNRWKRKLYLLMEEPSSGREAFFVHVLVTGGIIFSALLTVLSTLPAFHTNPTSIRLLFGLDTTIVVLFTIEYLSRAFAHSDTWTQYYNWSTSFFAILDFIAIFPYYIEVARNDDTSILFRFSILRTFRLFRVFRAFKYQNQMLLTIEVMYVAVQRSRDALVALSFFIMLVLVFFSTLIYFAERGTWDATLGGFVDADGDPSLFDSIPQTAWFALVTMSTVGYGDVVPRSFLGKLLTMPLLMFGLLLIALPSFVLGRNFAIVFDAMTGQAINAPSIGTSPRESLEEPVNRPNVLPPLPDSSASAPLLPTTSADVLPSYPPSINAKAPAMVASGSAGVQRPPRMWDGGDTAPERGQKEKDLTNTKLAKNQLVLLDQIDSLRRTIDKQGEMLNLLMGALNLSSSAASHTVEMNNGHPVELGRQKARSRTEHRHDDDEKQFSIGSEDEDHGDER